MHIKRTQQPTSTHRLEESDKLVDEIPLTFVMSLIGVGLIVTSVDFLQEGGFLNLPYVSVLPFINPTGLPVLLIPATMALGLLLTRLPFLNMSKTVRNIWAPAIALGVLGLGILPDSDLGLNLEFWTGYGLRPFATSLALVTTFFLLRGFNLKPASFANSWAKSSLTTLALAIILLYAPLLYQPPNGLLNLGDTTYHVIDELLAPYTGHLPYSDYSPQYTGMLGVLLLPLRLLSIEGAHVMIIVVLISNLFNLLLPLLATLVVRALHRGASRIILFAACITTCFASGEFNGSSTMLKEFSYFARLVPVLLAILLLALSFGHQRKESRVLFCCVGIFTAISVLNNADVGLAFGIVVFVTLILSTIWRAVEAPALGRIASWFALTVVAYFLVGIALGRPFKLSSYLGLRLHSPRDLYGPFPFHAFGSHILVLAICACAIAVGIRRLRHGGDQGNYANAIVYLITGLFILAMLIRFVIRPIPQGISGLLIPTFIPGAMLVIEGLQRLPKVLNSKSAFQFLPLLVVGALPIGAIWQVANPIDELRRVSGEYYGTTDWSTTPGRVADGYSPEALALQDDFVRQVSRVASTLPHEGSVGYFGIYGNTVQVLTGIQNYLGIPAPESLRFGGNQIELACQPLLTNAPDYLIVYGTNLPCKGYVVDVERPTDPVVTYRKL